ncbi:unnamed protein product [Rotaria sp. Silwood2]|nr:unnamed protein product [Rotaria sp. Silwood2]CAF3205790.1 unnamed protein product [Rotaria sp. Silwood2]CAF3365718.1 unnamed protein product [Rotaria sp. Silwood2]CAF4393584.1 unnamed protein product [Rotaria sp. Silwood2]CAF4481650.1 unnamed protein product [Rotaria sp. Silwood2]
MTYERALEILIQLGRNRIVTDSFIDNLYVPPGDPPTKFFWSGFGVDESPEVAAEIARYHNGVTLEMVIELPANAAIKRQMCKWPQKEDVSPIAEACRAQWKKLSRTYAEKTRGKLI